MARKGKEKWEEERGKDSIKKDDATPDHHDLTIQPPPTLYGGVMAQL